MGNGGREVGGSQWTCRPLCACVCVCLYICYAQMHYSICGFLGMCVCVSRLAPGSWRDLCVNEAGLACKVVFQGDLWLSKDFECFSITELCFCLIFDRLFLQLLRISIHQSFCFYICFYKHLLDSVSIITNVLLPLKVIHLKVYLFSLTLTSIA